MIHVKRINAVSLVVRDIEKSMDWYREKLGFEKKFDDAPNSPSVVIGRGDVELVLRPAENPNATPVNTAEQICIPMLCFEVDAAELDRVETEFAEDADIVKLDDHPQYRSRITEDPDGHAIEFYANK
ncbi:MAG: VOC family protein [Phycisphaerae bacterium]|nr:VOC family protein [Phycisphaerae bacterium]